MRNKKGFTLVELLATLVIISILIGIAVSAVGAFMGRGKKQYYHGLEVTLKAAGQDYMVDYKSLLPREIGNTTVVTVEELVKNHYMDELLDENKQPCGGSVTVEKTGKNQYEYHVCLQCNSKYASEEQSCELVGDNNEAKNYSIELNGNVTTVVDQCQNLSLPNATVYQVTDGSKEVINSNLLPVPSSVDTTILGETSVKWIYRYKSLSKTVRVEDHVKPTTPIVKLTYLNGSEYTGRKVDGTVNITNQNLNMIVTSRDYACPTIYPTLDGSGLSYISYQIDENDWVKVNTNKNTTKTVLSNTLFGNMSLKVVDKYNNSSDIVQLEIYTDKVKPSKTTVSYLGGSNSHSWKNNYKLQLSATDDIEVAYYEVDWNNDGTVDETTNNIYIPKHGFSYCEVRFRAVDIAGNRGAWSDTQDIHMDTEAPSKTTVSLTDYTSGAWTNQSIVQTYSATDALSGMDFYEYSYDKSKIVGTATSNWTLTSDGEYTIYARAVDKAGNRGEWSNSYAIKRDTIKPSCSLKISNSPSIINEWYTSDVAIDFDTKTDDRSKIKTATVDIPNITTNTPTNGTTVTGTVVDNANNSNTCTINIKANIEAPKITAKKNPLSLGNGDYTFTSNLTVTYGGLGGTVTCDPAQSRKTSSYPVTCTAVGNNGKSSQTTFNVRHSYAATANTSSSEVRCGHWDALDGSPGAGSCSTKRFRCSSCGATTSAYTCANSNGSGWGNGDHYKTVTKTTYSCPNGGTLSGTTCYY